MNGSRRAATAFIAWNGSSNRLGAMIRFALTLALAAALTGCATAPPVPVEAARADLPPFRVATMENVPAESVVWGGSIVSVNNLADTTELEILSYPLDRKFRPVIRERTEGRFILVMPGYVEALDWPHGRFVTVRGRLRGVREGRIEESDYVYPILDVEDVHLWPRNFPYEEPRVSFGIGVGPGAEHPVADVEGDPAERGEVGVHQTSAGGWATVVTAMRFQRLIVPMATISSAVVASPKAATAASQTSSGTPPIGNRVTASVRASAARSASVKNGDSCQAATAKSRRTSSPSARASVECMSTQNVQPFNIDARSFTSSSTVCSTFVRT